MPQFGRKIKIDDRVAVSSIWSVPEKYDRHRAVILAHGAGNDMHNQFLTSMQDYWSKAGVTTVKFNFPYKEKGGKLPDRPDVLMDTWRAMVNAVVGDSEFAPRNLFYAGKSLGGRLASMLAAEEAGPAGLIFLGYPLHPPGKTDKLRTNHLGKVRSPMLFIQGTRDALCDLDILRRVLENLGDAKNELYLVEGGDHSFKVLKKFRREAVDVYDEIASRALEFMNTHVPH